MPIELGQYIAKRRKRIGLTQEELAKRLEDFGNYRAASTIAGWETGKQDVPVEYLQLLARALEEPSPVQLYKLAGVLAQLPGSALIEMLDGASLEDVQMIEELARVVLEKKGKKP